MPINPPLSLWSRLRHMALWSIVLASLGLGGALVLPVIDDAMGLSLVRYRYRRYRRASRPRSVINTKIVVSISSLTPAGRIDRDKLRQSIEQKLKRIALCYDRLAHKGATKKADRQSASARSARRRGKAAAKKKKTSELLGTAMVAIELNPFGRATSTQLKKSSLSTRFHHCFVWFFRGRKFFAPQDNRKLALRLGLKVEYWEGGAPTKATKKKARKGRKRRRSPKAATDKKFTRRGRR